MGHNNYSKMGRNKQVFDVHRLCLLWLVAGVWYEPHTTIFFQIKKFKALCLKNGKIQHKRLYSKFQVQRKWIFWFGNLIQNYSFEWRKFSKLINYKCKLF